MFLSGARIKQFLLTHNCSKIVSKITLRPVALLLAFALFFLALPACDYFGEGKQPAKSGTTTDTQALAPPQGFQSHIQDGKVTLTAPTA